MVLIAEKVSYHCIALSIVTSKVVMSERFWSDYRNIYLGFWYFYRTQVYLGSDLWVRVTVRPSLSDVWLTLLMCLWHLVAEATNSILADDTNRAIPGNLETQVRQSYLVISTEFQNLNQISESQPNFWISTKFQNLDQISESQPSFWISTKFQNLGQISESQPNFRISTKF